MEAILSRKEPAVKTFHAEKAPEEVARKASRGLAAPALRSIRRVCASRPRGPCQPGDGHAEGRAGDV